jgi:hypothetical protein
MNAYDNVLKHGPIDLIPMLDCAKINKLLSMQLNVWYFLDNYENYNLNENFESMHNKLGPIHPSLCVFSFHHFDGINVGHGT